MNHAATAIQHISIASDQPYSEALAQLILAQQATDDGANTAPLDLSHSHIILPNAQAVSQLRQSLSRHAGRAMISGFSGSLSQWFAQHIPLPQQIQQIINHPTRQLLLLEALKQHPDLFAAENHWQLCDSLLELFDELSLSPQQWLEQSLPDWLARLQQAYQLEQQSQPLTQEARIIHTLWQAWQLQLGEMQLADEKTAYKAQLLIPLCDELGDEFRNHTFYISGLEQLSPLEQAWCEQLAQCARVIHISQGRIPQSTAAPQPADNPQLQLLDDIYQQHETFLQRCAQHSEALQTTFLSKIKTWDAHSAEQEAQAIDLKIRSQLINGTGNIAVVTENRKLARRLRALLERADITIQDTAGWALATTSAATVIERWLECIEQDFAYQPLLDLLKSPFFCDAESHEAHLNLVYRLEQDIILHENIPNDLQRYRKAIGFRSERLNLNNAGTAQRLLELLDKLDESARELRQLFDSNAQATSEIWLGHFNRSIEQLGIYPQLSNDMAGARIQEELAQLQQAHAFAQPSLDWQDFRTWLGSTLERAQFKPHFRQAAVSIMNMQQAQYCHFDSLIIGGANMQSLPGGATQHPFFNQSVRQSLGLSNWQQQKAYSFYRFQQLLFAAGDILITWQAEKDGEWMQASPWVSSLQNFAQTAFASSLRDTELESLLQQIGPLTQRDNEQLENIQTVQQARPQLNAELLPTDYSASRQQRLIDCPYKFFAADGLRLKPLEEISQELLKSEYGEKVHLILEAFHQQKPGLPEPFTQPLTLHNKTQALNHLNELSRSVFSRHTEDNVQHRGWLERWLKTTEAYIDWQIQRQTEWQIHKLEQKLDIELDDGITLNGRLDRVDKNQNGYSIIDYKTGNTAKQQDIELAENIQLTSYAMLLPDVDNTLYLKLDNGKVSVAGLLEQDQLQQLTDDITQRLSNNIKQIRQGTALPAWGDASSCAYCDMAGLCRKQIWENSST